MAARGIPSSSSSMAEMASHICDKIRSVFTASAGDRPSALDVVVDEISAAAARKGRVFVHGVGREGLMLKALCMRLAHLGLGAHVVGDVTTPPIAPPDLLVASAGPGGFATVEAVCGVAGAVGARVLLLTARPEGPAARLASAVAFVPARTMAETAETAESLLLPMGSAYEGALFVLFEMVVFTVADLLGETPASIAARHTNLE
ncbi:hypothetical protein H6P81_003208 [Aristolochia fimbriata]|uniref:SIS domain-containing protein n=1 Tax=Aristolochia fimbriata TaxID=158543 RepID=A0AAV7FBY1_ARIFI|nr:hypothetical protein H6P81_003208 [Aristolochia fimbriata]